MELVLHTMTKHPSYTDQRKDFDDLDPFRGSGGVEVRSMQGAMGKAWSMALGGKRNLDRPYAQSPYVYACVRALCNAVRQVPPRLMREVQGKLVEDDDSPVARLFRRPNAMQSCAKFIETAAMRYLLDGESFWVLRDAQGKDVTTEGYGASIPTPSSMWQIGGPSVVLDCGEKVGALPKRVKRYGGGEPEVFAAGSVAIIAATNPYSYLRGMGPMTAATREAAKAFQADRYDEAPLRNSGRPGGYLTVKELLNEEEALAVAESFRQTNLTPDKNGRALVLSGGSEFKEAGFTPRDMEFQSMRESSRQAILSIFGVLKPVLGIIDDVNLANAREAHRIFWELTVLPFVRFLQDEIQFQLLDRIEDQGKERTLVLDTSGVSVLREDIDAKVDRTIKLFAEGGITLRDAATACEWRELADSEIDGLDDRWIRTDRIPHEVAADPDKYPDRATATGANPGGGGRGIERIEVKADESGEEREPETRETEDERKARIDAAWKAHDDLLAKHEKPMAKKVQRVFEQYVLAARKKLRAKAKKDATGTVTKYVATEAEIERALALNAKEWEKALQAASFPAMEKALVEAAEDLHAKVAGEGAVISVTDPVAVEFMAAKEVSLVEGATTTLAKDVQRKIVKVLAKAEEATSLPTAIAEVLDRLEDEMKVMLDQMGARAEMIARTEVNSAVSFGRQQQMIEDEVEKHEWVSSRDGAVRDSHANLDGKVVTVGKEFGYGLEYPGDPSAGVEQIVNCRCTTLPL